MTPSASPLAPLPPDPSVKHRHKTQTTEVMHRLLIPMVLTSILAIALGSIPLIILGGVVWVFWGAYYVLVTKVLLPSGKETPYRNQHSDIEAMEIQGRYQEASDSYQHVIATDPEDLVACEKLAQLALRQLKDYPLALFAYREAEKRATEPRRCAGFAMLVAGIYRDNLKDYGKAMVEMRRIVATYPDVPNRARLSAEIDELKSLHFEAQ